MSSSNTSLKADNTLGLDVSAKTRIVAETTEAILSAWQMSQHNQQPFLVLGEGSNVLFLEDFAGIVVINRIKGVEIRDENESWKLHVGAGENWHQLVKTTLEKGISGLENLALIPGMVGSAPIQNIGAYGVELKDVCEYVDVLNLHTGITQRLSREACQFGYRDSIFKHQYQSGYTIIAVGFSLKKHWQPVLTYGDLKTLNPATANAWDVFHAVCHMRQSKLPDPKITGNVGSFFKNPVITGPQAAALLNEYPTMPNYPQSTGDIKLAAGWLIDQCQLKGYRIGGAEVHQQQALVLINAGNATPDDIVALAKSVRAHVGEKFNVWLEPEVRFIKAQGECNAVEVIS
ncbi:UDP-N-acetylmuramate dehydrogenase [Pantoea sp. OXWO6B1]|uniref:UDP-N-acetylmuramate dehydrogenase n=1 Tax=Pantoea sp. OXWO6B1 TaxID=1835724 RepID=UPI0007C662C8|nr:UDP-N-acetylmuramate dehydrogenase [Pantoea sp. OXWO6B1]OAE06833.1 UDP-N-acetylenolpyruvoylglucosamine reductase [Pantoea sp. OXWO6B1]